MQRGMPPQAKISWDDQGSPRSDQFGDIYYDSQRGWEEARFVFLEGCGLPAAWQNRSLFVVGETGFGTGLNFLATWDAWRETRQPGQRLHYVSVEGYPLEARDIQRATAAWPGLKDLAVSLTETYPVMSRGFHRLHFDQDRVCLTLLVGPVESMLQQLEARVDAWFLDGFAPSRNPEMWNGSVCAQLARLSVPGARLATFTAAGSVRRELQSAGFDMGKAPGFGRKRERLVGVFQGHGSSLNPKWAEFSCSSQEDHTLVVGRGVAGAAVVRALDRRDRPFEWIGGPPGASANPAANVMPRFELSPGAAGRFMWSAYRYALRYWPQYGGWQTPGSLALARTDTEQTRHQRICDYWGMPPSTLQRLSAADASAAAGVALSTGGLWYPESGLVSGPEMVNRSWGVKPLDRLITSANRKGDLWYLQDASGEQVGRSHRLVLATGASPAFLDRVDDLPLQRWLGDALKIGATKKSAELGCTLVAGRYLTPAMEGTHWGGASFSLLGKDPKSRESLLAEIASAFPDLGPLNDSPARSAWSETRSATPDRLPCVGPLPDFQKFARHHDWLRHGPSRGHDIAPFDNDGVWSLLGLGARGFTTAPLCGEWLVSMMFGEPWPLERDLALALHSCRFLVRDLKRGTSPRGSPRG